MGQVEIRGKVDIFQYWPNGASDVDTLQFVPDMPTAEYVSDGKRVPVAAFFQNGGNFQEDENKPGQERFRSIIRSSGGKFLSVRLQGIDAPETHYASNFREGMFTGDYGQWLAKQVTRKKSHRQPYGKLCTDLFASGLRTSLGIGPFNPDSPEFLVEARLTILADSINGAVDVYGRVIGYVTLIGNGQEIVLNDHALANGFAFCSFYGSMAIDEMQRLTGLYMGHGTGEARKSQLRDNLSDQLLDFEPELWTTASMRENDRDDNRSGSFRSRCFDPKIFRRCVDWVGRREALGESIGLLDYIRSNDEEVVFLSDFVAADGNWARSRKFAMGSLIARDGGFLYDPGEVVFEARPVIVVDRNRIPLPDSFVAPYP